MDRQPKPFDCSYSPQFAELLSKLKISLAISTYQAGKVVIISAVDTDKLIQLPRNFENAMGMASSKDKLAVSSRNEVIVMQNRPELASSYPSKRNTYDGIFVTTSRYNTGYLALHDMEFLNNKIVAVNTLFSCLSYIDSNYSFTPFWQPPFISQLLPEDRCHLNGIATDNNEIKYLTALGNSNSFQGWRDKKMNGGILMEYPSGRIILDGLAMPHSPRIYDGKLYVLDSARGQLIVVDTDKRIRETVVNLGGFARGMARYGDYLFIGVSKLRHNSKAFSGLKIAKTSFAGVIAVHLPYKAIAGSFKYEMSVDEIYDVKVIEGSTRPSIVSPDMPIHGHAITTPAGSFWSNPDANKSQVQNQNEIENQEKQPYTAQLSVQVLQNISAIDLAEKYPHLLYSLFRKKLQNEKKERNLFGVIAFIDGRPVALSVTEIKPNHSAELLSLFVSEEFRKQGIAGRLLQENEQLLEKNRVRYIDASWVDALQEAPAIETLIKSKGWLPLQRTLLNMKINVDTAISTKRFPGVMDHEYETEVIDWTEISELDKEKMHLMEQENGFPAYLSPFQLPELLDTKISKIIRVKGETAGWCIFHHIKGDTAQCSALYISKIHRNKNRSLELITRCFLEAQKRGIHYIICQVNYQDNRLIRYVNSLADESAIVRKYHTLASRKNLLSQV